MEITFAAVTILGVVCVIIVSGSADRAMVGVRVRVRVRVRARGWFRMLSETSLTLATAAIVLATQSRSQRYVGYAK